MSWLALHRPDAQTAPSGRWLVSGHSVTWGENSHGQAGNSGYLGLSRPVNLGRSSKGPQAGGNWGDLCLYFSVPGCGPPPLSVSSAVCPTALGALHGGSVVSRSGIHPPNLSLSLRGPTSQVLSVSVRQCSVGWSLMSQTSPGLPLKILRGSHQVLWIRIRTF